MKYTKVTFIKILLAVVSIAAVCIAGWYFLVENKPKDTQQTLQEDAKKTVEQLNQTGDPKKLNEAKSKLEGLAKNETDPKAKLTYLNGAMDAAGAAGEYKSALAFAKQIDSIEKTDLSAATYAGYAELSGDYKLAVKQYDVAIKRASGQAKKDYEMMRTNAEANLDES